MPSPGGAANSPNSRLFLQKTARSIAEIQSNLDTIPDVVVFLEILGYNNKSATDHGFANLYDFARHVYEFVDLYSDREETRIMNEDSLRLPIPRFGTRIVQGLTLTFPWIGSLVVLFVFGVSLWLAWGMPIAVITSLIVGVFLGLLASDGPMQMFQRLFIFHYGQGNIPEARRALSRSYLLVLALAGVVSSILFIAGRLESIPFEYTELAVIAAVSILIHRVSYVVVYALKKFGALVLSYTAGFTVLVAFYYLAYNLVPLTLNRYLDALGLAFATLCVLPIYYAARVYTSKYPILAGSDWRQSFNPMIVNSKTIRSRFEVQFWENLPLYAFGTLFFATLFGDRVLSWYFNPSHVANGIVLPLVFNAVYHIGADVALIVVFPAAVLQYAMMTSISEELSNLQMTISVGEGKQIDRFIKNRYWSVFLVTVAASAAVAFVLLFFGPRIIASIGGTTPSVEILRIAALSNIGVAIFMANSIFLIFVGKTKQLVAIAGAGLFVLAFAGVFFGRIAFEDIVIAYGMAAIVTASCSTIAAVDALEKAGSLYFSRYS
jgi:hypothetical protein